MQSPTPNPSITFTELVALVGALATLITIAVGIYKLGSHAADLKNTKDNLGRDVATLGSEMRSGFETIKEQFDEDRKARRETNDRVRTQLADHETRLTVIEKHPRLAEGA